MGWGITKRVPPDKNKEEEEEPKINRINEIVRSNQQTLAKRLEGVKWLFDENGKYQKDDQSERGISGRAGASGTEEATQMIQDVTRRDSGKRTQGTDAQEPREKKARLTTYQGAQQRKQDPDPTSVMKSGRVRNPIRQGYPDPRERGSLVQGLRLGPSGGPPSGHAATRKSSWGVRNPNRPRHPEHRERGGSLVKDLRLGTSGGPLVGHAASLRPGPSGGPLVGHAATRKPSWGVRNPNRPRHPEPRERGGSLVQGRRLGPSGGPLVGHAASPRPGPSGGPLVGHAATRKQIGNLDKLNVPWRVVEAKREVQQPKREYPAHRGQMYPTGLAKNHPACQTLK